VSEAKAPKPIPYGPLEERFMRFMDNEDVIALDLVAVFLAPGLFFDIASRLPERIVADGWRVGAFAFPSYAGTVRVVLTDKLSGLASIFFGLKGQVHADWTHGDRG
jgi:hypothetical protein